MLLQVTHTNLTEGSFLPNLVIHLGAPDFIHEVFEVIKGPLILPSMGSTEFSALPPAPMIEWNGPGIKVSLTEVSVKDDRNFPSALNALFKCYADVLKGYAAEGEEVPLFVSLQVDMPRFAGSSGHLSNLLEKREMVVGLGQ